MSSRRFYGVAIRVVMITIASMFALRPLPASAHDWKLRTLHSFCAKADCADGGIPADLFSWIRRATSSEQPERSAAGD
jgi:hypothetical protein